MPHFLIRSQRFQLVINYVFLTITFETGLLINVSQDCTIPFTTPVNYYPSLVLLSFFTLLITIFQHCALELKANYCNMGDKN